MDIQKKRQCNSVEGTIDNCFPKKSISKIEGENKKMKKRKSQKSLIKLKKLFFSDDRFEIGAFGIELLNVEECVAPRLHRARVEKVLRLEVHLVHSGVTKCDLKNKTKLIVSIC
jgi:hypothetical protein